MEQNSSTSLHLDNYSKIIIYIYNHDMKTKNTTGILGLRKKFIRKTIRELRTQFIIFLLLLFIALC